MVVFHTIVCILLVIVVLMQSAKGEGLAGAFGGGGGLTGAVFGGRGAASFLSKATTVLAIVFMINCGALAYMSANRTGRGAASTEATTSAVTQEAAKEIERQAQQQQQSPVNVEPSSGTPDQSQPTGTGTETPPATEGGQ
jgi:preprotein translocase subunit SecG